MKEIYDNLQKPEWWFTALFVGVIASLIAGFLKDWIPTITRSISSRMRIQYERSKTRKKDIIDRVNSDIALATLYGVTLIVDMIMLAFTLMLGTCFPIIYKFYSDNPHLDIAPIQFSGSEIIVKIFSAIFMISSMVYSFRIYGSYTDWMMVLIASKKRQLTRVKPNAQQDAPRNR